MESSFWSEPTTQPCHICERSQIPIPDWCDRALGFREFDFTVEHRPGIKIKHIDALSRHVAAIMQDGLPSKEEILAEQRKTPFVTRKPGTQSSKSEYFLDDDGVLYKRRSGHKHQLVVPKSLVKDIIKANYDPVYFAHPDTKRTVDLIFLNYWWPSMRKSVEDYIRKCDSYQRRKEEREFVAPLGKTEEPLAPSKSHPWISRVRIWSHRV
jgi:hypothetical protein